MVLLGVLSAVVLGAQGVGPATFEHTPSTHWAFEALDGLQAEGLLRGPRLPGGNWTVSRFEMAQVVAATIEGLPEDRTTIESVWVRHPSYEFTYVRNRISNLKKLINTFSADLESQGKNPEALQRKVGEVLGSFEVEIGKHLAALRQDGQYQFRDVPKGHWAYDATYDLKILGILNGYDYDHYHG